MTDIGLETSIDLMRNTFAADGTGLDALLDIIDLSMEQDDSGAIVVEIINTATNNRIQTNIDHVAEVEPLPETNDMTELQKALNGIKDSLNIYNALFSTSLPQPDNSDLLGLFHESFFDCGDNRDQFLNYIAGNTSHLHDAFVNPVIIDSTDLAKGEIWFSYEMVSSSGSRIYTGRWLAVKNAEKWQFAGDRSLFDIELDAELTMFFDGNKDVISSGLDVQVRDKNGYGAAKGLDYIMVEGPGFLEQVKLVLKRGFEYQLQNQDRLYQEEDGLDIDAIKKNEESVYTFKFYNSDDIEIKFDDVLDSKSEYKYTTRVAPIAIADVLKNPDVYFPQLSVDEPENLCGFSGGDLTFSLTKPAKFPQAEPDYLDVRLWVSGGDNFRFEKDDMNSDAISATVQITEGEYLGGRVELCYQVGGLGIERSINLDILCQ